jgi:type VI secretion system secreted protein VgrG
MNAGTQTRSNVSDFEFRVADRREDDLRVIAFEGTEGLSELFDFRIRLSSVDDRIDLEAMLGQKATLQINGEHGTRVIHGIIRRFARTRTGSRLTHYEARLVPPHWLLTRRIQSRVFNPKRCERTDVPGLVAKVLSDAGLPAEDLKNVTSREYEAREFTVQYRESDWNFVSRLLEEEGIYYYFEHDKDSCKLVLVDSKDVHPPLNGTDTEIPFRQASNLLPDHEFVYVGRRAGQVRSGAVSLDDFDFRDPGGELRQDRAAGRFTGLPYADYPGGYVDVVRGRRLVETRLDEKQCATDVFTFTATVRGFRSGCRFRLGDHPDERFNSEYLITSVSHRASQSQSGEAEVAGGAGFRYRARLRAIAATVQFRPPRVTFCPTVLGSQTALVVGPPGEEIHTDEFGRVEVRFHWDQEAAHDVGASCWIRVSQGWAGGQYGMLFLPRVGQEVIVDFLEGDPDQPIITGRVYNRDHMPPYKLPDQRTISAIRTCSSPGAKGGNEIRFEDAKQNEQLLLFAQNSMHLRSRGSRYESVCGDAHQTVAGDAFELVKKNKDEWVKLDVRQQVDGSKWDWVTGALMSVVKGKHDHYVKGLYRLHNASGIVIASDTSLTLWCAGNFIKIDSSGVTIVANKVKINSGGSADPGEMGDGLFPQEPVPAATTEFGHNTRYKLDPHASSPADAGTQQEVSWIEIELIDEFDRPCPNEPYEVILPDGKKIGGTLDGRGRAHVAVPDPGLCQVTFPRLDAAAWEAIT